MFKSAGLAIIIFFIFGSISFATKLDVHTHDLLIEKLEGALGELKGQSNEGAVLLRLADLYADRARVKAIEEAQLQCDGCLKIEADRRKAIGYYKMAMPKVDSKGQAKALLQMAHLYSVSGETQKAYSVLSGILEKPRNYNKDVLQSAAMALGEQKYLSGYFVEAEKYFNLAKSYGLQSQFLNYRLAWCRLNQGDVAQAKKLIITVVKSVKEDEVSLKRDAARDLATILSRESVNLEKVEEFLSYSEPDQKINNLFYLGEECDRLDNNNCSHLVWSQLLQTKGVSRDRLIEARLRLAQNDFDANRYAAATQNYKISISDISNNRCEDESVCVELKPRLRSFVMNWLKKEKAKPSRELLDAMQAYVNFETDDFEIALWAGHVGRELKQMASARANYRQSADAASRAIKNSEHSKSDATKTLNSALLHEIECAEFVRNDELLAESYQHYIQLNPQGREIGRVRSEYAFLQRRQAVEAAMKLYKNGKASDSDLEDALEHLQQAPMLGATDEEKTKIYYNQIQIASKLKDLETVEKTAIQMLKISRLSPENKEFALERRLWVAEMQFDFIRALTIMKKMRLAKLTPAERQLKLAVMTELSGANAKSEYLKYLKLNPDITSANHVRSKIVHASKYPWAQLSKYRRDFEKTPQIYAQTLNNVFASQPNIGELRGHLKSNSLRRQPQAKNLELFIELENQKVIDKEMRNHRLYADSEKVLQRKIKERILLLKRANRLVDTALRTHNFTLHTVALQRVARENARFADELQRSRRPRGLSAQNLNFYNQELNKKVAEYKSVSDTVIAKIEDNFSNSKYYSQLLETATDGVGVNKRLAGIELKYLLAYAPKVEIREINSAIRDSQEKTSLNELRAASHKIKNDPFDIERLEKLKELAQNSGSSTMVAFLEARLTELKRGG